MASNFTNTNIDFMNLKQIRAAARNLGVTTVHSVLTAKSALITAIKAK